MKKDVHELEEKSVGRLLLSYSIPAVIAMVVNAIYNVVDRIFIGKFVGEEALAGIAVIFPVMVLIFSFATLIGVGGSTLLSINLGKKDIESAKKDFGVSISYGVILIVVVLVLISIFKVPILNGLGATDDVIEYSLSYLTIILYGGIFQLLSFIFNNSTRAEGRAFISMGSMITAALTNIVLDYVFIVIFNMGVEGAAIATIIGQFVGFLILVSYYLSGKSILKLKLKDYIPNFQIIKKINAIGFASFILNAGGSIAIIFMNIKFREFGGTSAITAIAAIGSFNTLVTMPIMGVRQGAQPIMGYNYGAKRMDRVYETLKIAIIATTIFTTIAFILVEIAPKFVISFFIDPNSNTAILAEEGLRIFMIALPILSINIIGVAFFQSTGRSSISIFLGAFRQIFIIIPLIFMLPIFFSLNGVFLASPLADIIATVVTFILIMKEYKKDKKNGLLEIQGYEKKEPKLQTRI